MKLKKTNRNRCFADVDDKCVVLKTEKYCGGCNFYKSIEQAESEIKDYKETGESGFDTKEDLLKLWGRLD